MSPDEEAKDSPQPGRVPSGEAGEAWREQEPEAVEPMACGARWVRAMPWVVSIGLHGILVAVAVVLVWSTVDRREQEEVVPVVQLGPEDPGQPLEAELDSQMELPTAAPEPQEGEPEMESASEAGEPMLAERLQRLEAAESLEDLAQPDPFGGAPEPTAAFETEFFGVGGNARHIAFLVDASGSLMDTMPYVLEELQETIGQLDGRQTFTVIFFQGEDLIEPLGEGMKPADVPMRERMGAWIDPEAENIRPGGRSHPIRAIEHVLEYDPAPQLIFLLSDNITGTGRYAIGQAELLDRIVAANTAGAAINTLQFIYEDPRARRGVRGTMELIADRTGGRYKFISSDDLGLR